MLLSRSHRHPSHIRHPLQIEFYFSDSNLFRDDFLSDKVRADEDGFVDIALLCIFQRMQAILGASSSNDPSTVSEAAIKAVADALEGSKTLVLSEDKRRVRRAVVSCPPTINIPRTLFLFTLHMPEITP